MSFIQEAESTGSNNPKIYETAVLDEWEIEFGEWVEQGVFWIDNQLGGLLDVIKWPFDTLLNLLVTDFLVRLPWIWIVLLMFMIGWMFRSLRVGLFALVALSFCGILGPGYWIETAKTIGFIFVAVILCVAIGIPVGIACGRIDPVWSVVRPVLDAMQVVHSFVYMLPFIFFFGLREVSATMVTMVFALPPLIRLTNLGIRQVPEDVVEASRAYGASEYRVLTDVQIPLARPAIMTGVNQTLLLSISMLGIAAIMGAGGLGALMFRALSSQNVARGASAGLAFFLVAVTLDRISQPVEGHGASLMQKIRGAWANRANPQAQLLDVDSAMDAELEEENYGGHPAGISPKEGRGLKIAIVGAVIGVVSVFLTWGTDAGMVTSHSRFSDADLFGASFSGLAAEGGTFFGFIVLGSSLFIILAALSRLTRVGSPRYFSADGVTMAAFLGFGGAIGYFAMNPSNMALNYSDGIGVTVALIGTVIAIIGGLTALSDAPYAPHRPVPKGTEYHKLVGAALAIGVLVIGSLSGWSFDQRDNSVLSPEDVAEVERLTVEADENPALTSQNAVEISAIHSSARRLSKEIHDSWNDAGTGLGPLLIRLGLIGVGAVVMASGAFGAAPHKKWRWSVVSVGLGLSIAAIGGAWIASLARSSDDGYVSGIGAFLVLMAGLFFVSSGRSLINEFFRIEVFDDEADLVLHRDSTAIEKRVHETV